MATDTIEQGPIFTGNQNQEIPAEMRALEEGLEEAIRQQYGPRSPDGLRVETEAPR